MEVTRPALPSVVVNGRAMSLADAGAHTSALDWLRTQGLTGAKEGCAEGECGACAVLVADETPGAHRQWSAVNACLAPALWLAGREVRTAEGLGTPDALHPVQEAMARAGGSQCGYCTPGFVCSMAAEYYRPGRAGDAPEGHQDHQDHQDHPSGANEGHLHGPNGFDLHALSGNLCRCTGYRSIRDAAYELDTPTADDVLAAPAEPTDLRGFEFATAAATYRRPGDLDEALDLLARDPDQQIVAGATDYGVDVNLKHARPSSILAIDHLSELRAIEVGDDSVTIGATATLTQIDEVLGRRIPLLGMLIPQFASRLIRNRATLGGNLGTASPIGDSPPVLLALDASVVLSSRADGRRTIPLTEYFTGYRHTVRRSDELITAVLVPLATATPRLAAFHKIAKRRFDDISSVAIAFAIDVEDGIVTRAAIGLGGVAATPLRAVRTEAELVGRRWESDTIDRASAVLGTEGTPLSDHRASAAYRCAMLGQALRKLYAENPVSEAVR